ncbi:GNAT family N-acetyltransferase [Octadecabacter sp. G9-8]|uniref:GNAT family N-acetyltransferase n=1 Tax=Octadecabacter dasysiphoniae TaxID=2909341 RepID=A0ABS9CW33_9RHOB|nr:GNAT family N-acetyltransferase [Octadecabacter dasysiphoniae]MCF2871450.1 GNAT family N-acetyltransferase [Octadecabacter dasysiphoniae]
MTLRSLTMRSELFTLSGLSHLTQHEDTQGPYLVQSTPTEPHYWVGNQLILPDTSRTPAETFALFEAHFPNANHRAAVWDIPGLDPAPLLDGIAALGCDGESVDALLLGGPLRDADVPDGIVLRPFDGPDDWAKALDLQLDITREEGNDAEYYQSYLERRNAGRRVQISKGLGQWFGAFDGDVLVTQMGMFHNETIARYQSVETRLTHRRRGICSALLRHAALWALGRAPDAQVVIVAEADSDAGRLYRQMGFKHAETIFGVMKGGY